MVATDELPLWLRYPWIVKIGIQSPQNEIRTRLIDSNA